MTKKLSASVEGKRKRGKDQNDLAEDLKGGGKGEPVSEAGRCRRRGDVGGEGGGVFKFG